MPKAPPLDPLRLDPEAVAILQSSTFTPDASTLVEPLERSPLFAVARIDRCARGEWIRYSSESDPSLFPLGRVVVHPGGVLLEAFGEERMKALRSRVNDLNAVRVTPDEIRVVPIEEALNRPAVLMQPIHELDERELSGREVAETFLRMGWPFIAREDLGGRAPHVVIRTGRGRRAIAEILEKLPEELRDTYPALPDFDATELRGLLLPQEPRPIETPETPDTVERETSTGRRPAP
jgi:hypothetical protein